MAVCPFCSIKGDMSVVQNAHTLTIRDTLPVSPGHILIIPKRHIASIFDAHPDECVAHYGTPCKWREYSFSRNSRPTVSISASTTVWQQDKLSFICISILSRATRAICPTLAAAFAGFYRTKRFIGEIKV